MMKHVLFAIGLLCALGVTSEAHAQSSAASSSAASTLYTRIKQQVEKEEAVTQGVFDDDVVTFLRLLLKDRWDLSDTQIQDALQGNKKACSDAPADSVLRNDIPCREMLDTILKTAEQEQNVRTLGRRLTTLVTGYELPLSDLPERTMRFSADLLGILNIWSAGTGSILSESKTPDIRTVTVGESVIRPQLEALARALNALPPEQRIAAVWRLRGGVLLITGARSPRFPAPVLPGPATTGTERQYLDTPWTDVESALRNIRNAVGSMPINPPLTSTETAYAIFPAGLAKAVLPDNIVVWVRIDGAGAGGFADAGLDWNIPLEPVFPSLKKDGVDEVIPGGNFPPEPIREENGKTVPLDGMTLCTNPIAARGYLCRPFEALEPSERCPIEPPADGESISLVHCTVTGDKTESTLPWCSIGGVCKPMRNSLGCFILGGSSAPCGTLEECQRTTGCRADPAPTEPTWCCLKNAGNMCALATSSTECVQRGGSPSQDEEGCVKNGCEAPVAPDIRYTAAGADVCREIAWKNTEPFDPQTQCRIGFRCASICNNGSSPAYTSPKRADGGIDICIAGNAGDYATISYTVFHELVHAYQFCGLPPANTVYGTMTKAQAAERCCRMEGEANQLQCGMMERDGLFENQSFGGVPIDAASCAEVLTDAGCKLVEVNGEKLPGCFMKQKYPDGYIDGVIAASKKNPKKLPDTCADAIDPKKMDPRVKALKDLIEKRDNICTPATETQYKNRIGNNMCYIGQCAEQSVELHRIAAGRSPAGVQDPVAPWQEPLTGTPLGNLLTNPPLSQYRFPPYRPELLAQTLDSALCQSVGLPRLMPPVLCMVEATRQLDLARTIGLETVIGLAGQTNEQDVTLRDLVELSRGVGVRTGTEMYADYLRESSRSFAEIIGMAARLLRELDAVSFPTQMCPIDEGLPERPSSKPAS